MSEDIKTPKESAEVAENETLSIKNEETVCAAEFPSGCIDVEQ